MRERIIPLEIIFSLVVIVIVVSIITLICLQINLEIQIVNKNSEASLIASNILENMNTRSFENIEKYIEDFAGIGTSKKIEDNLQNIIIYGDEFTERFFGTEIPEGYTVEFSLANNLDFDILKDVDIEVSFFVKDKEQKFSLSTVIEREKITECNSPIITDEYFKELDIDSADYYIIPIKYSNSNKAFVVTTKDDPEWYNYSSKKWAKVAIFPNITNLKELFIDEHDKINEKIEFEGETRNITDFIYVWIPNFSVKEGTSLFRYGTGKRAIRMSFLYSNSQYLYLNTVSEEIKDISEDCSFDGLYGVWRKLYDDEDAYYQSFNQTRFAPINLY